MCNINKIICIHSNIIVKWEFRIDEEEKPGFIIVEVMLAKFLDSSLIHIDMHPTYVTIVIKNKVLRLKFSEEVTRKLHGKNPIFS